LLPALYALLIPFAGMPAPSQYTEMDRVWEILLLLAAVTSFFSFPYTAGYGAAGRKLFLSWGIAAAGCGVTLLATAHGEGRAGLERRPLYRPLLEEGLFRFLVRIRREGERRVYTVEELR